MAKDVRSLDDQLSKRFGTGDKLMAAAWAVEIVAASIGLLIAGTVILRASEDTLVTVSILAALPFLMVAVIELCKIPVATAAYHTRSRFWRSTFAVGLVFLMVITFETMLNGFEWGFALRTSEISAERKNLITTEETIKELQRETAVLSELSEDEIRNEFDASSDQLNKNRDVELREINQQILALQNRTNRGGLPVLEGQLKEVSAQLGGLAATREKERAEITKRFETQIGSAERRFESEKVRLASEVKALQAQLRDIRTREEAALGNCTFFCQDERDRFAKELAPVERTIERARTQLSALSIENVIADLTRRRDAALAAVDQKFERQRSALQQQRGQTRRELLQRRSTDQRNLQPQLAALNSRRNEINKRFDEQLARYTQRRNDQISKLEEREARIANLNATLAKVQNDRLASRNRINELASSNQLYRVAALFMGKDSPADVTNDDLKLISWIWFGSLAAITAWTGTLLAFAGLVVKHGTHSRHGHGDHRPPHGSVRRAMRNLLIDLRRRSRKPKIKTITIEHEKPVEVVKEVPVEKVALKEVPKEVVRRELVYVPFYTNDPELLNMDRDATEELDEVEQPKPNVAAE